ncbi:MAG: amylo-alpha-1,6-glucosidase [Beijerinckiaceae bacterium]
MNPVEAIGVKPIEEPVPEARVGAASTGEPRIPLRLFALKDGDTFAVADASGNIVGDNDGLFRDDARVLSLYTMTLGGVAPSLLSAQMSQDNVLFVSNLTNRPLPPLGGRSLEHGVIHVERKRLLHGRRLYERICITNFARTGAIVPLEFSFAADFLDMFEVRGMARRARGKTAVPEIRDRSVQFSYLGLDGVERRSCISFSEQPISMSGRDASFVFKLGYNATVTLHVEIGPDEANVSERRFRAAEARARWNMRRVRRRGATLRSRNHVFDDWLEQSRADLALLTTELPTGPYPYAGIPWFSTPFGRDAIITSLQILWLDPSPARGVLAFLAEHQAHETSAFRDSAPGKIMHEARKGEMAATKEVPFGLYYGGVDTTPLFIMLAGAYADRTADLAFIESIWPALERATTWILDEADSNSDGLVDYARLADTGLANQGWKDSHDSVFHRDGSDPVGPIALVEVQGYCYAALRAMAGLARRRELTGQDAFYLHAADTIRARTEARFWMPERDYYALAIDGAGKPCDVRTTNAGHLLYTGLASPERAGAVMRGLMSPSLNSGWGFRTLARDEARFNPMSYHNGSVWPHDTALCVAGMARYGERAAVVQMLDQLFQAAVRFERRLPELYCGFARRGKGDSPVAYPVACAPQAWASGAAFMALQAALGISIDAWKEEIRILRPHLPHGVETLEIRRLRVGSRLVNLTFQRIGEGAICYSDSHFEGRVPVSFVA